MFRETLQTAWQEGNTKVRLGMVAMGLGLSAVAAGVACETVSHFEINGYSFELRDEAAGLAVGGMILMVSGQGVFISGARSSR